MGRLRYDIELLVHDGKVVILYDPPLVAGVDYDPAVCDDCGRDVHSPAELAACIASALGPVDNEERWTAPRCGRCDGRGTLAGRVCTACQGTGYAGGREP